MAEKHPVKKAVAVSIGRKSFISPKSVLASSFHIVPDPIQPGCIEILFNLVGKSSNAERVIFDGLFFIQNPRSYTHYLTQVLGEIDDAAQSDKIPYAPNGYLSNILNVGASGQSTETTFSLVSLHEWGNAVSAATTREREDKTVDAEPVLSVYGTTGFQKKLISEMLRAFQCL